MYIPPSQNTQCGSTHNQRSGLVQFVTQPDDSSLPVSAGNLDICPAFLRKRH